MGMAAKTSQIKAREQALRASYLAASPCAAARPSREPINFWEACAKEEQLPSSDSTSTNRALVSVKQIRQEPEPAVNLWDVYANLPAEGRSRLHSDAFGDGDIIEL